jgi:hypothetical protein
VFASLPGNCGLSAVAGFAPCGRLVGAAQVSRMFVNVAVVAESEVLVALPGC